jgi:hypothetical protein
MERHSSFSVRSPIAISLAFALATAMAAPVRASTIVIINNDGAGEGFNDPTPVAPVGGNPGTTRGAQRLNVFNQAASIWGSILPSGVTIQVLAQFNSQTCNATSGVLGSAGARTVHSDFPGAEFPNMWYCQALANKLSGTDLSTVEDINATFNSDVDNSTCLGATSWYYGFDGNDGTDIELLPVVLHELGHGLGFQTFANTSTGQLLNGAPDIYLHYLLDRSSGLHWDQMTSNQRKNSATNTGNLVWDGFAVNFRAPNLLQHEPEVVVVSPGSIAGSYVAAGAEFGPPPDAAGVNANVVLVNDGTAPTSDACEPIVNGAAILGNIAILDRGTCTFVAKVAAAQAVGAVGVIVVNNVAGAPAGMAGTDPTITIPAVMISQADGTTIKNTLLSGPVNATIQASATKIAGIHPNGGVKLYSPNPLEAGSSVSHWDVSATPNLLMEPIINFDLHTDVDLTRELFEDIGWLPRVTAVATTTSAPSAALRVQSAPNPFRPSTVISLELPRSGATRVEVYDLQGRMVKRLVNQWLPAGHNAVTWDGTDAQGRRAAAGVYFSRVASAGLRTGKRLVKLDD